MSGSGLTAQRLEPALDSVSPSHAPPLLFVLCLSQKQINIKKNRDVDGEGQEMDTGQSANQLQIQRPSYEKSCSRRQDRVASKVEVKLGKSLSWDCHSMNRILFHLVRTTACFYLRGN